MFNRRAFLSGAAGLFAFSAMGVSGTVLAKVSEATALPSRFVVGTTLISDILIDLLPEAKILTLAQGSSCPIHGDMKSQDAFAASEADMILIHDFQTKFPAIKAVLTAADHPGMRLAKLTVGGNWMTPPVQKAASQKVAQTLIEAFPAAKAKIETNLAKRLAKIDLLAVEIEKALAPMKGMAVVASARQADFLEWAGFKIKATYMTAQDLSPLELIRLIRLSRDTGVVAVVDNQQSGADLGGALASELKIPHVTLSNFPVPGSNESTFFSLLTANVNRLSALTHKHTK